VQRHWCAPQFKEFEQTKAFQKHPYIPADLSGGVQTEAIMAELKFHKLTVRSVVS